MNELLEMMRADLAEKQQETDNFDREARRCGWYNMEPGAVAEREHTAAQIVILKKYIAEIKYMMEKDK